MNDPLKPSDVRFARTANVLGRAVFVLAATAAIAAFVPGRPSRTLAWVVIAAVIAIPLTRVVLLGRVWMREGDRRYAAFAVVLLAVVATGAVAALLR